MEWKLELVVVPVSDVERAKRFYSDQVGFAVDHDTRVSDDMHIVQLTPPGSACSVTLMRNDAAGSVHGLHLVVDDIEAAQKHLADAEVTFDGPFHFGGSGQTPGLHPERAAYGTFLSFNDPDGNTWLVQEVRSRT